MFLVGVSEGMAETRGNIKAILELIQHENVSYWLAADMKIGYLLFGLDATPEDK